MSVSCLTVVFFLTACSSESPLIDLDKPLSDAELKKLLQPELSLPAESLEAVTPVKQTQLAQTEWSFPANFILPPDASIDTTYRYIITKILNHEYDEALGLLNKFTDEISFRQSYGMESRFLRLIVLAGLRAGYLELADTYQTGWDFTLKNDYLETGQKIDRLAKYAKQTHFYYRCHKKTLLNLIDAHDEMMAVYLKLSPADFKFTYPPVQQWEVFTNPYLSHIKLGRWLEEPERRQEAEKRVFSNAVQAYFLSLLGTSDIKQADLVLKNKETVLDRPGFLFWLNQGLIYHTQTFREGAFGDQPGLIKVVENKSIETKSVLKTLLTDEKDLTFLAGSDFNPDKLLSQYNLK